MLRLFTSLGRFASLSRARTRTVNSFQPSLEPLENRDLPAPISFQWIGPQDGLWGNRLNWQDTETKQPPTRAPAPGEGDKLFFSSSFNTSSNNDIEGAMGALLDIAQFQVAGHTGTITLEKGLKIAGPTTVTSGKIDGAGDMVIGGNATFTWSGGELFGSGGAKLVIEAGSKLNISGTADPFDARTLNSRNLENLGTVSVLSGLLDVRGGEGISIRNSNLFELSAGTGITTQHSAPSKFENLASAKLQVTPVAKKIIAELALNLVNNNQATLVVPAANELRLYAGGTLSGTVDLGGPTTTIEFRVIEDGSKVNASYKLEDGLKLTGQGRISALGGVDEAKQWVRSAWLEIADKVTIDFTDQIHLHTAGATILGPGTLRFASGTSTISNTWIRGSANLKIETGAFLNFGWHPAFAVNQTNSIQIYGQSKIDSSGTVSFTGTGGSMDVYLYDGALLQVASSGVIMPPAKFPTNGHIVFTDQTNIRNYAGFGAGSINSQGAVFRKPAGSGVTQIDVPVTAATRFIDYAPGGNGITWTNLKEATPAPGKQMSLLQGGPLETAADGSLRILPGSSLYGGGTIDDTPGVTNSGTLVLGDTAATAALALTTNFTQDATGALHVELGGTSAGETYDQLSVTFGFVTLGGRLSASLLSGFTPSLGQTFTILDNVDPYPINGNFDGLAEGAIFNLDGSLTSISYVGGDGNDVVLTIVSTTPGQWASEVDSFSSEYTPSPGNWSAWQATGPANTFDYDDLPTTWSAEDEDIGIQNIVLRFPNAVYATGVTVRETWQNGFVVEVVLIEPNGTPHSVWAGDDPTPQGAVGEFTLSFPPTDYLVDRVQIFIDTNHTLNEFEDIDAVMLHGDTAVQIVDDGEASFSASGGFSSFGGQGYQNDVTFASSGTGAETATWTFTLTPGVYRIAATWFADGNRATNAPFTILDGTAELGTVLVNQQLAPNHFAANGAMWHIVGGNFTITTGTLVVRLSDDANEFVIADAIRVERLLTNPVQIIDDGDAGFFATENFDSITGQGFQDDVTFASAGAGEEVATWTFTELPPGVYRISVTWAPHPNRADNSPFSVLDGETALGTFFINQEISPDDYLENGTAWEDLGDGVFAVSSGTLVVRLTNAANEFVIADAVRIERIGDLGEGVGGGGGGMAASVSGPASLIRRTSISGISKASIPAIANFSVIGPIRVDAPVTFRFANPRATGLRYSFDFNNDGDFTDAGEVRDSASASAQHTFTRRGWHLVHGRVTTLDGRATDFWLRVFVEL